MHVINGTEKSKFVCFFKKPLSSIAAYLEYRPKYYDNKFFPFLFRVTEEDKHKFGLLLDMV